MIVNSYNSKGEEIKAEKIDDKQVFCKRVCHQSYAQCFIKAETFGISGGMFLNPTSMWFDSDRKNETISRTGKERFQFKKVSQEAFDLYIKFLKTGNVAYLRNAERMI